MRHPVNEQAITVSVGQFIKIIREAEERHEKVKPSMYSILEKNGVKSQNRAKQLIQRMIEHEVIVRHRDGSYTLRKKNWDFKKLMPLLLKKEYNRKPKAEVESETTIVVVEQETINPLDHFDPQELVDYLRSKGWTVKAHRDVTVRQTLWWKL